MKRYKKLFVLMSSFLLAFLLSACTSSQKTTTSEKTENPLSDNDSKILVAYFSCTGTTKSVAKDISDSLDATLYEITPENPYTSEDLDYNNNDSRTSTEQNDNSSRPAISKPFSKMEEYDIVFIGYPIWWGKAPKIISTFLESYDFSEKTIIPFCTSASSDISSSATDLQSLTTNSTSWIDGRRFSGSTSKDEIIDWLNSLELEIKAK